MSQKSSRGVQQADVWAAADALIGAGERPTIERVRMKIGSGSPNTVSPLLDAWYRTLPGRLGVGTPADDVSGPRLPVQVSNAARALWEVARREADELARMGNEAQRNTLDRREGALVAAEAELQRREEAFVSTRSSLEDSLSRANETVKALQRQVDTVQERHVAVERQVDEARRALAASQMRQEALQKEHLAALAQKDALAREMQERQDTADRRALLEVDRAREEARVAVAQAAREAARSFAAQAKVTEARDHALEALRVQELATSTLQRHLTDMTAENGMLRERLGGAEARREELAQALLVETNAHATTRGLLAQAMSMVPGSVVPAPSESGRRRAKTQRKRLPKSS